VGSQKKTTWVAICSIDFETGMSHLHCIWSLVISSSSIDSNVRAATGAAAAAAAAALTSLPLLLVVRFAGTVTVAVTTEGVGGAVIRPLPLPLLLLGAVTAGA
jgi:hypothetical protein